MLGSASLFWVRETCTVDVRRPSFTSRMVKRAGPTDVRRRKVRCSVMVCGWLRAAWVVEKWRAAAERKHDVTKPP